MASPSRRAPNIRREALELAQLEKKIEELYHNPKEIISLWSELAPVDAESVPLDIFSNFLAKKYPLITSKFAAKIAKEFAQEFNKSSEDVLKFKDLGLMLRVIVYFRRILFVFGENTSALTYLQFRSSLRLLGLPSMTENDSLSTFFRLDIAGTRQLSMDVFCNWYLTVKMAQIPSKRQVLDKTFPPIHTQSKVVEAPLIGCKDSQTPLPPIHAGQSLPEKNWKLHMKEAPAVHQPSIFSKYANVDLQDEPKRDDHELDAHPAWVTEDLKKDESKTKWKYSKVSDVKYEPLVVAGVKYRRRCIATMTDSLKTRTLT